MSKLAFIIIFLIFFISPSNSYATEVIRAFQTDIIAHKNGDMTVTETIKYDFGSNSRHGIFRFIPTYTPVGDLFRISDIKFLSIKRDGKSEPYDDSYQADRVEVKIGDPDKSIKFEHTYEIVYQVKNGIGSNYNDHDEIYWDLTGNEWDVPIEQAAATVTPDFNAIPTKTICYTGPAGSKGQDCQSTINGSSSITTTTKSMDSYEGLTVVTAFPVGTFPKSELSKSAPLIGKDLLTFLGIYALVWIILNTVVFALMLRWYLKNRNQTQLGKHTVHFDIPKYDKKSLTPLEAGIIDNTKLEQNDVMATIFDLAIKKYIKIEQIAGKKTLGVFQGKDDYKIVKLKDFQSDSNLEEFEKTLLDKILKSENEQKLSDIKTFYLTFTQMEKQGFEALVKKGFYIKNPKDQKGLLLVLGIILTASLNVILGPLLIYLSTKMNGRTIKGDTMDHQVEGLKIFLKNMRRHYNFQAKNAITVEKYIPYAMAFGLIDEFMDQIKEVYPEYNPSWYSGSNSFYSARMAMVSSMSSHMITSAPSSSSGFSGGGSSGGGGGGGGGGSW